MLSPPRAQLPQQERAGKPLPHPPLLQRQWREGRMFSPAITPLRACRPPSQGRCHRQQQRALGTPPHLSSRWRPLCKPGVCGACRAVPRGRWRHALCDGGGKPGHCRAYWQHALVSQALVGSTPAVGRRSASSQGGGPARCCGFVPLQRRDASTGAPPRAADVVLPPALPPASRGPGRDAPASTAATAAGAHCSRDPSRRTRQLLVWPYDHSKRLHSCVPQCTHRLPGQLSVWPCFCPQRIRHSCVRSKHGSLSRQLQGARRCRCSSSFCCNCRGAWGRGPVRVMRAAQDVQAQGGWGDVGGRG